MNVGIFGGSFNPPHVAHLIIAESIRDQFGLDEVWWIPNAQPPHKPGADLAPAADRLAMTERAVGDHPHFVVSDIEIRRAGVSYTVETLRELQNLHPDVTFWLIIGSDSLNTFSSWHQPNEIAERVGLIVYKRPGEAHAVAEPRYANGARFASAPILEISSTEIRARCQAGRSIRYLVPAAVHAFIEERGLYQPVEEPEEEEA